MTLIEIIGNQQIRIHHLEEELRKVTAANHHLAGELKKVKPEMFADGRAPVNAAQVYGGEGIAEPTPGDVAEAQADLKSGS